MNSKSENRLWKIKNYKYSHSRENLMCDWMGECLYISKGKRKKEECTFCFLCMLLTARILAAYP